MQGSRSGKTLGIGELLASVCSASAPLDRHSIDIIRGLAQSLPRARGAVIKHTDHKIMPGTELAAASNKTYNSIFSL